MKVELQTQPGDITCWESAVVVVEHNELFPASTWVWREDNQSSRKVARAYTHPFWPCGCGLAAQLKIHEIPSSLDRNCPRPNPCYIVLLLLARSRFELCWEIDAAWRSLFVSNVLWAWTSVVFHTERPTSDFNIEFDNFDITDALALTESMRHLQRK